MGAQSVAYLLNYLKPNVVKLKGLNSPLKYIELIFVKQQNTIKIHVTTWIWTVAQEIQFQGVYSKPEAITQTICDLSDKMGLKCRRYKSQNTITLVLNWIVCFALLNHGL